MNIQEILANPKLHKAATTVAVEYAKRMLEGQYTRLAETAIGQQAKALSRPKKLAIEAALNALAGYLSTKEEKYAGTPLKSFFWDLAMDAPSEISKRLLNGDHPEAAAAKPAGVIDVEVIKAEEATVLEGLLKMPPEDLTAFLAWLQTATPEERHGMAEAMAGLSEAEQAKFAKLSPEQARLLLASMTPKPEPALPSKRVFFGSLADSLRSVNERLEKRSPGL